MLLDVLNALTFSCYLDFSPFFKGTAAEDYYNGGGKRVSDDEEGESKSNDDIAATTGKEVRQSMYSVEEERAIGRVLDKLEGASTVSDEGEESIGLVRAKERE